MKGTPRERKSQACVPTLPSPSALFTQELHRALDRLTALGKWDQPEPELAPGRVADQRLDAAARRLDLPDAEEHLPGIMAELRAWERTWAALQQPAAPRRVRGAL